MALTLEEIDSVIAEYQQLRTVLVKKEGRPILWEAFKGLFDTLPERVKNIWWTQGTPSWCDGDPCTFSVYDLKFNRNVDSDDEDYDDEEGGIDAFAIRYYLAGDVGPKPSWRSDAEYQESVNYHAERRQELLDQGWTIKDGKAVEAVEKKGRKWLDAHEDFMDELFGNATVVIHRDGTIEDDEAYLD